MPAILVALTAAAALAVAYLTLARAAGGLAALVLLALSFRRPVWGLAVICALLPVEGIAVSGRGVSEIRLLGMAVFAVWVVHMLVFRKRLRVNSTMLAVVALIGWAGISFLWAGDWEYAGPRYGTLVQLLLLFVMAVNVIDREEDLSLVFGWLLAGALVSTALSISLFITNFFERARAFEAQNPNEYGVAVGLAIIGGIYLAVRLKNRWLRLLSGLAACYLAFPLLLAQSRTCWLAVAAALTVFLWHTRRRLRNLLIVGAAAGVAVAAAFSLGYVNVTLIQRTSELLNVASRGSNRSDIWRVGDTVFLDHPVIGVGFGQFPRVYNRYRYATHGISRDTFPARDPHSIYYGVATELGLVGLALLALVFWKAWRREGPQEGSGPWITAVLLVFILVSGIGINQICDKIYWLVLALAVRSRELAQEPGGGNREAE